MNNLKRILGMGMLLAMLSLTGCGSDNTSEDSDTTNTTVPSVNQASYIPGTTVYQFGYNSIPNIAITKAPSDTDWNRWAMLHDGSDYRLYFFKEGTDDTIYQFAFNSSTASYEFGYNSIPEMNITGAPADADPSSFAMLHDGSFYRLYMRSKTSAAIHQFAFNSSTLDYEYGYNSIPKMDITGAPADTDFDRWGMLHDGSFYRFYAFKGTLDNQMYQFAFNPATSDYEYGYNSILVLTLDQIPADSDTSSFAMLHDGLAYRFYFLTM